MQTTSYDSFFYRQRDDAPLQVAFVASSSEIDGWARVPTKRTGTIRNFQRAELQQHVKEVQRFFKDHNNASPTAVVIGFDPVRAEGRVRLLGPDGEDLDDATVSSGTVVHGAVVLNWAPPVDSDDKDELVAFLVESRDSLTEYILRELEDVVSLGREKLDALAAELQERLVAGKELLGEVDDNSISEGDGEDDADADSDENEAEDRLGDLSGDSREAMEGLSPSERQILVGRLEFLAQCSPDFAKTRTTEELRDAASAVADELKPGILIDGQHRVMGTKKLGSIPFLVCALPKASWPELAFQFLVTNRTAKRVQESLLINIVGNSLSKNQRADMEERLRDAGIRVGLIEAVMKVHEDELSPFFGMLEFGIKGERGFIDAAAMRNKVIKYWYERKGEIQVLFDHACEGRLKRDRTDFWKAEELWFDYFISFWSAVRDRYEGSAVFGDELDDKRKPVSKLMTAMVLKIFQETVIENIEHYLTQKQQKDGVPISESIKSSQDFADLVTNSLRPLTPEFFVGWQITGFDGSKGARDDLAEAINEVINQNQTVAMLKKKPHRLFKEN